MSLEIEIENKREVFISNAIKVTIFQGEWLLFWECPDQGRQIFNYVESFY